jgi:hypothetical protein
MSAIYKPRCDFGSGLRLHRSEAGGGESARLQIAGWPASLHLWTAREFAALAHPPADAMAHPSGAWFALRIE